MASSSKETKAKPILFAGMQNVREKFEDLAGNLTELHGASALLLKRAETLSDDLKFAKEDWVYALLHGKLYYNTREGVLEYEKDLARLQPAIASSPADPAVNDLRIALESLGGPSAATPGPDTRRRS